MNAEEYKNKGNESFKNKNYKEAIEYYTKAINVGPKHHTYFCNRSICHISLNDFKKGLEDAEECIKLDKNFAKGYFRKGQALKGLSRFEDAKKALQKGLELEPNTQMKELLASMESYSCSDSEDDDETEKMDTQTLMKFMMIRSNSKNSLFSTPETKQMFIKEDIYLEEEEKWLEKQKKISKSNYKKSFILKIQMMNIQPLIYRKFQVPGSISLYVLHDKIICPVMGWCRNYHAYYYQRFQIRRKVERELEYPAVGPCYGPIDADSIDMMHASSHGISLVDSKKACVADLFQKKGDKLLYIYDLGDTFKHKIICEEIGEESDEIDLLEGKGACPNEDGSGNSEWAKKLEILTKGKKQSEYYKTLEEINRSANYGRIGESFPSEDPYFYDLKKKRKVLQLTLNTKESPMDASNMFTTSFAPMSNFQYQIDSDFLKKKMGSSNPKFTESIIDISKKCDICKSEKNLKLCARCRTISYCSVECQKKGWELHKLKCKKIMNE